MRPFRHLPIIANVMVPLGRRRGEWVKSVEAMAMGRRAFPGRWEACNQDGELVMSMEGWGMFASKPAR